MIELYNSSFAPGLVECEVQVFSGSGRDRLITSAKFNFSCRRSIMNEDTVQSTDEYPILIDLIKRAEATEQALADIDQNEGERQAEYLLTEGVQMEWWGMAYDDYRRRRCDVISMIQDSTDSLAFPCLNIET